MPPETRAITFSPGDVGAGRGIVEFESNPVQALNALALLVCFWLCVVAHAVVGGLFLCPHLELIDKTISWCHSHKHRRQALVTTRTWFDNGIVDL